MPRLLSDLLCTYLQALMPFFTVLLSLIVLKESHTVKVWTTIVGSVYWENFCQIFGKLKNWIM